MGQEVSSRESFREDGEDRLVVWPPKLIQQTPLGYLNDGTYTIHFSSSFLLTIALTQPQEIIYHEMLAAHRFCQMEQSCSNSETHSVIPWHVNSLEFQQTRALFPISMVIARFSPHISLSKIKMGWHGTASNKFLPS